MKYCENYKYVTQRHDVRKCCWKNGSYRFAECKVATNLQFVKNTVSVKHNKAKWNEMRKTCLFVSSLCLGHFMNHWTERWSPKKEQWYTEQREYTTNLMTRRLKFAGQGVKKSNMEQKFQKSAGRFLWFFGQIINSKWREENSTSSGRDTHWRLWAEDRCQWRKCC